MRFGKGIGDGECQTTDRQQFRCGVTEESPQSSAGEQSGKELTKALAFTDRSRDYKVLGGSLQRHPRRYPRSH